MTCTSGYNPGDWLSRLLIREGTPRTQNSNCVTVPIIWSSSPIEDSHQNHGRLTVSGDVTATVFVAATVAVAVTNDDQSACLSWCRAPFLDS